MNWRRLFRDTLWRGTTKKTAGEVNSRLRRIQKFSRRQVMSEAQAAPATKTLFTAEFLQDPYPAYRRFLEEGRVHYVDYGGGMWAVFKHAECSAIMRDPRLSARRTGSLLYALPADKRDEFAELARMLGLWMLFFDAHEHFIQWSDALAIMMGNPRRTLEQTRLAQEAVLALTAFFRAAVAERRRQKGSDLISLLLDIEEDGDVLTEEELYAQCVMLLFGGHETTRNLIGNGIYTLLRHPAEMAELRESPEITRTAVEELLRYESPVQYTSRTAKEDLEVCGAALHQGQQILFMLGAANRDPQQFKEPDQLNLKRLNNPHLAFGAGAHFCIGNQLARLEGQIATLKMVQQFPRMRLASPRLEWAANFGFRGLKTLPVVL